MNRIPLHVAVVLDRSGSMSSCRSDAVGAVNSYVVSLRENEETAHASVTVVLFDSQGIDAIRAGVPARTCPEITPREYIPRAATPLLDAVGRTVANLEATGDPQDKRMIAIMTDGLENASREYTYADISALLAKKQKEGWHIAYLGAEHDAWTQAERLGVAPQGRASFSKGKLADTGRVMYAVTGRYLSGAGEAGFTDEELGRMADEPDNAARTTSRSRRTS